MAARKGLKTRRSATGKVPLREAFGDLARQSLLRQFQADREGGVAVLRASDLLLCIVRLGQGARTEFRWMLVLRDDEENRIEHGAARTEQSAVEQGVAALQKHVG